MKMLHIYYFFIFLLPVVVLKPESGCYPFPQYLLPDNRDVFMSYYLLFNYIVDVVSSDGY